MFGLFLNLNKIFQLPMQPVVENLRLSEEAKVRSNSKSPSRLAGGTSGKQNLSNMELALAAPLNYKFFN